MSELSRREFAKLIAAAGVASRFPQIQTNRVIGIQVGAVSFVDEGMAPVLDRFQRGPYQRPIYRDVHVWSWHRRTASSRPTVAGSRQAGVRHRFSRRQLCAHARQLLHAHFPEKDRGPGPSGVRRSCQSSSASAVATHEGLLLV